MKRADRVALISGAVLMVLLGVARGGGGLVLLLRGGAADPRILASPSTVALLAVGLVVIGLIEIIAAIGVMRGSRPLWVLGVAGTVLFVLDGVLDGYLLYGAPGGRGTVGNVIVAVVIIACLISGRNAMSTRTSRRAGDR